MSNAQSGALLEVALVRAAAGLPVVLGATNRGEVACVRATNLVPILVTETGAVAIRDRDRGLITYVLAPSSPTWRIAVTGAKRVEATDRAIAAIRAHDVVETHEHDQQGWALQLIAELASDSVLAGWLDSIRVRRTQGRPSLPDEVAKVST